MIETGISAWEDEIRRVFQARPDLETWGNHLEIRLPEIRAVSELAKFKKTDRILEIGCGNGLASAIFSRSVAEVIASDLPDVVHHAHSIGLERAQALFDALQLKNISTAGCSAESLPFPDASFDVVFSFFALEHIPNLPLALKECRRVLKKGGRFIAAVPAAAWSLSYPLAFYFEFAGRLGKRAFRSRKLHKNSSGGDNPRTAENQPEAPVVHDWESFHRVYKHFPFPEPHGEYKNYFDEFWMQRPSRWRKRCEDSGFRTVGFEPISVLPRGLLMTLMGDAGWNFYQRISPLEKILCKTSVGKSFAQSICLIAEK